MRMLNMGAGLVRLFWRLLGVPRVSGLGPGVGVPD